jgi:hypothetical protein
MSTYKFQIVTHFTRLKAQKRIRDELRFLRIRQQKLSVKKMEVHATHNR